MNIEVQASDSPADIPGNTFGATPKDARDVTYFIAYLAEEPVAQVALVRKGNRWWMDYLFIREDMRGKNILFNHLAFPLMTTAAKRTPKVWMNCIGITWEDVLRHRETHGTPASTLLNSGIAANGQPFTLIEIETCMFK